MSHDGENIRAGKVRDKRRNEPAGQPCVIVKNDNDIFVPIRCQPVVRIQVIVARSERDFNVWKMSSHPFAIAISAMIVEQYHCAAAFKFLRRWANGGEQFL
jgi:hypothetical protein